MRNPFKGQRSRAQRAEDKRKESFVKEKLIPLLQECENAYDMKERVEAVTHAFQAIVVSKAEQLKRELKKGNWGELGVKPFPGRDGKFGSREEMEKRIIELFSTETIEVAEDILTRWINVMDLLIKKDLRSKKPSEFDLSAV